MSNQLLFFRRTISEVEFSSAILDVSLLMMVVPGLTCVYPETSPEEVSSKLSMSTAFSCWKFAHSFSFIPVSAALICQFQILSLDGFNFAALIGRIV